MKQSRFLSFLLAAAFVVTSLTGCGGDSGQTSANGSTANTKTTVIETETETQTETTKEPVEMTTITIWSGSKGTKECFERLAEEFNNSEGKELGIEIEYIVQADYNKVAELAFETGQGPDFFANFSTLAAIVEKGYAAPITDLPGGEELVEPYLESGLLEENKHVYNGEVYSLPGSATARGLVYNKDMFKAAGLVDENGEATPPKTYDEMREYAEILTDVSKGQYGFIIPLKWGSWVAADLVTSIMGCAGFDQFNPITGEYDYSVLVPILETYEGMIADGSVYPDMEGLDNDTARAYFSSGCVGMKIAQSYDVAVFNSQFPATCDWGVAPLPVLDEEERYYHNMKISGTVFINKASLETKDPEKMKKVLEWYASDHVRQTLYAEGLELPADFSQVEGTELNVELNGWAEFAAIAEESRGLNAKPSYDMTGLTSLNDRILTDVLSGNKTAQEVIEQYNQDINEGVKKYYEANPQESLEDFLDPDWDVSR